MTEVGVAFGTVSDDVKQAWDETRHKAWLDETKYLSCAFCGKPLCGKAYWHLALDMEHEEGSASGFFCMNGPCIRRGIAFLRKTPRRHW